LRKKSSSFISKRAKERKEALAISIELKITTPKRNRNSWCRTTERERESALAISIECEITVTEQTERRRQRRTSSSCWPMANSWYRRRQNPGGFYNELAYV